ncbi:uncharacterized protein LOC114841597 [Diachasma alloeum]|uniref:uncharacterized protein LOC114841597 n=1 Tax=Diachasma alloeum TaxID=454923 RepID=UPI0010FB18BF|nr:uncharacterized protein LOC114841597 [Diachasma alloeum]
MKIILDLQGFQSYGNEFILKEIGALIIDGAEEGDDQPISILFEAPCDWNLLSPKYKWTNSWLTSNHHGLAWVAGDKPYEQAKDVLQGLLNGVSHIIMKDGKSERYES